MDVTQLEQSNVT